METTAHRPKAAELVVVDAALEDYRCLADWAKSLTIRLTTTSSGAGGLRLIPSHGDALWLVSLALPDITGFELLEMIRSVQPRLTCYAVDAGYAAERERRALELSAARYLCKPVQTDWVRGWSGFSRPSLKGPHSHVRLETGSGASLPPHTPH